MLIPILFVALVIVTGAAGFFAIYYFDLIEAPELRQPRHGAQRTAGALRRALALLPRRHRNRARQTARASSRRAWARYARAETVRAGRALGARLKNALSYRRKRREAEDSEQTEVLGSLAAIRKDIQREKELEAAATAHLERRWKHGTGQWPLYQEVIGPPKKV